MRQTGTHYTDMASLQNTACYYINSDREAQKPLKLRCLTRKLTLCNQLKGHKIHDHH